MRACFHTLTAILLPSLSRNSASDTVSCLPALSTVFGPPRLKNFPLKSNALLRVCPLRSPMMPLMSKATFRPVAGWASWSLFVGGTALMTVGFDRRTTGFSGHPLNSGLDFESNAGVVSSHTESGVNLFSAADAAPRSLKSKGTNPSMYWPGSLETSTHWNFWALICSPCAMKV